MKSLSGRGRYASRASWCAGAAALLAAAGSVSAAPKDVAVDGRTVESTTQRVSERAVRIAGVATRVRVDDAGAARSLAWHAEAGGDARAYELTDRVVVRAENVRAVARALREARADGARVRAHEHVDGFVVVEAGSVGAALDAAERLRATGRFVSVEPDVGRPRTLRAPSESTLANGSLWHLRNTVSPIADINADGAWDMGYTGAGVTIGIVEGGIQESHPDLAPNFVSAASMVAGTTSHATSCAGVAAAAGDNAGGAVGLAYQAGLSEQNFGFTDADAAAAFSFRNDLVDVKSNSWGPSDNGWIAPLSAIERAAIEDAVTNGRGGLGTVFTWAAGNGRSVSDRADYDGYASSRFTFAIGSIGEDERQATYSEPGASVLAVTHSDGDTSPSSGQRGIFTTTSGSRFTSGFGGTSTSAPLAAGAIALALEANPALSWRDVMHLIVETARQNDLSDSDWSVNGAGHDINHKYGFGVIDAGALCAAAETWTPVGPEISATSGVVTVGEVLEDNAESPTARTATIADSIVVESVEVIFSANTPTVGDLRIRVISPEGTASLLAEPRNDPQNNYSGYVFMTARPFGESGTGDWTVEVTDARSGAIATWTEFEIRVYGTADRCSPADLDGDQALTTGDIDAFVTAFLAQDAAADIDGDGDADIDDISAFTDAYLAGCG